jgi:hypothetical protein
VAAAWRFHPTEDRLVTNAPPWPSQLLGGEGGDSALHVRLCTSCARFLVDRFIGKLIVLPGNCMKWLLHINVMYIMLAMMQ